MDPNLSDYWAHVDITAQVFEGLVTLDARGRILPAAAQSWQMSEDGSSITFTLKDKARWSNGKLVTARDFARGFQRAAYAPGSRYKALVQSLFGLPAEQDEDASLGAKALSETQIRYRAASDHAIPIEYFSSVSAFPMPDVGAKTLAKPWFSWPEHISNGPYQVQYAEQESLNLIRNPHYLEGDDPIHVESATYIGNTKNNKDGSANSHLYDFLAGKVDILPKFEIKQLAWVQKHLAPYYIEPQFPSYYSHLLLSADSQVLDWPSKRRLYQAVDFSRLGKLLHSRPSPTSPDYQAQGDIPAFSGYSAESPLVLRFGIFTPIHSFVIRANALASYWRGLPIQIKPIHFTDFSDMRNALKSGDIDMASSTASPDFPGRLSRFLAVYPSFSEKTLQSEAFKQSVRLFSDAYVKVATDHPQHSEATQAALNHFTTALPFIPLEEVSAGVLIGKRFKPMAIHGQSHPRVRLSELRPSDTP